MTDSWTWAEYEKGVAEKQARMAEWKRRNDERRKARQARTRVNGGRLYQNCSVPRHHVSRDDVGYPELRKERQP